MNQSTFDTARTLQAQISAAKARKQAIQDIIAGGVWHVKPYKKTTSGGGIENYTAYPDLVVTAGLWTTYMAAELAAVNTTIETLETQFANLQDPA